MRLIRCRFAPSSNNAVSQSSSSKQISAYEHSITFLIISRKSTNCSPNASTALSYSLRRYEATVGFKSHNINVSLESRYSGRSTVDWDDVLLLEYKETENTLRPCTIQHEPLTNSREIPLIIISRGVFDLY